MYGRVWYEKKMPLSPPTPPTPTPHALRMQAEFITAKEKRKLPYKAHSRYTK